MNGEWAHDGKMSRRGFLGAAAAGVAVALGGGLTYADAAAASVPRRGGRLRIAWSQQSINDTLNPLRMNQNLDFLRVYSLMSPLVKWDRQFQASPDLAVEWNPNADMSVWSFRLRQGVVFQNGKPLVPEDVVYSLNLHRQPGSVSMVRSYFSDVTDIRKDGVDRVVVTLKAPNADFPVLLGDPHTVIVPEGFANWDRPVGTGPFELVEFRPGIGMVARRFANHYKADTVYVDEVETFGISDTGARMDALISGDAHYINRVDARTATLLDRNPRAKLVDSKASRKLCINTMANGAPFSDINLRTAIKYAVDRAEMVKRVLNGYGQVANDLPIGPRDRYYDHDLPQREFDLDKARFYYKKSGFSGQLNLFTSDVNYGAPATDFALELQETAGRVGIPINLTRLPAEGYYAQVSGKKAFNVTNWFPRATLDLELRSVSLSNSPQPETGYRNPKLDALALEARRTPDGPKRAELYAQVQEILWDADGRTIPVFVDFLDGRAANVQGVVPHPFSEAAGLRLCEEVWLA